MYDRPIALLAIVTLLGCSPSGTPGTLVARGTVEAREVTLRSEASGRIVTVKIEEGDSVKEDQELVHVDRQELDARALVAQATRDAALGRLALLRDGARPQETAEGRSVVEKARATLRRAEDAWQRALALQRAGSVSEEKVQDAEASARIARAELMAAEQRLSVLVEGPRQQEVRNLEASVREADAQLGLIGVQIARTTIKAPFAGTITRKSAELGEILTPGTPVCTLTDTRDLRVKVYLSEQQLPGVTVRQPVTVRADSASDKVATGHVLSIASTAEFLPKDVETAEDRVFQVFAVKIGIEEPIPEIKPGMNVTVLFSPDRRGE